MNAEAFKYKVVAIRAFGDIDQLQGYWTTHRQTHDWEWFAWKSSTAEENQRYLNLVWVEPLLNLVWVEPL